MAVLYITEFADLGSNSRGDSAQIGTQTPTAEQTVAIGGGSTQSAVFQNNTRVVRLHTDAICSVEFGTNPTATSTKARMAANQTEYYSVPTGSLFKVAVITNT